MMISSMLLVLLMNYIYVVHSIDCALDGIACGDGNENDYTGTEDTNGVCMLNDADLTACCTITCPDNGDTVITGTFNGDRKECVYAETCPCQIVCDDQSIIEGEYIVADTACDYTDTESEGSCGNCGEDSECLLKNCEVDTTDPANAYTCPTNSEVVYKSEFDAESGVCVLDYDGCCDGAVDCANIPSAVAEYEYDIDTETCVVAYDDCCESYCTIEGTEDTYDGTWVDTTQTCDCTTIPVDTDDDGTDEETTTTTAPDDDGTDDDETTTTTSPDDATTTKVTDSGEDGVDETETTTGTDSGEQGSNEDACVQGVPVLGSDELTQACTLCICEQDVEECIDDFNELGADKQDYAVAVKAYCSFTCEWYQIDLTEEVHDQLANDEEIEATECNCDIFRCNDNGLFDLRGKANAVDVFIASAVVMILFISM